MGRIERLLFVDTETTGLEVGVDQVVEIFAASAALDASHYARVTATYHALIRPMYYFSTYPASIRGVRSDRVHLLDKTPMWSMWKPERYEGVDWSKGLPIRTALRELIAFWIKSRATWFGQNPKFDIDHLQSAAAELQIQWPSPPDVDYRTLSLDSMLLPLVQRGDIESVSLAYTRKWAECPGEQSHRARGDVSDMINVYNALTAWHNGDPWFWHDPFQTMFP